MRQGERGLAASSKAPGPHRLGRKRKDSRGFSLVELLVAMVILSVGLLALAGGMSVVVGNVTRSGAQMDRTAALQSGLETVRSTPFDELSEGVDSVGIYEVRWEVKQQTQSWKKVELTVEGPGLWGGGSGAALGGEPTSDSYEYTVIGS